MSHNFKPGHRVSIAPGALVHPYTRLDSSAMTGTVVPESTNGQLLNKWYVPVLVDGFPQGRVVIARYFNNPCCFEPHTLKHISTGVEPSPTNLEEPWI